MDFITIDESNIDSEHICCAIGEDKANKARARTKKEWMKGQLASGLVFKRLDARGKVFIEYMPIEKVWKPLAGHNYMVINCLWVSGQYKGKGYSTRLLDECVWDVKERRMNGVAVVSSDKVRPFLTDKKYYIKHGFEMVDTAKPYFELLALKFDKNAPAPRFNERVKTAECDNRHGFMFIYANQCPFMEDYVALLNQVVQNMGNRSECIKLQSCEDAQNLGSPFGTLGIYYNGRFLTHELMTEEKFKKFIKDF